MRNVVIKLLVAALATVALAGCDTPDAPPGTPGSLHVRMNGQVATSIGLIR